MTEDEKRELRIILGDFLQYRDTFLKEHITFKHQDTVEMYDIFEKRFETLFQAIKKRGMEKAIFRVLNIIEIAKGAGDFSDIRGYERVKERISQLTSETKEYEKD